MAYTKQNFADGAVLYAAQLNHMEDGIEAVSAFLEKNDLLGEGDPGAQLNMLTGNYTKEQFLLASCISSTGAVTSSQYTGNYVVTPLIPIDSGKKYAVKTTGVTDKPTQKATLSTVNDGYGLFGSDGETVIAKTLLSDLGDNIVLFEAPAGTAYVRFCLAYKSQYSPDAGFDYAAALNQWVMIEGDENTAFEDFDNTVTGAAGVISEIYRADGTAVEIEDKWAREEISSMKSAGSKFAGKTIVNFGDSIYGNAQPPVDVSTELANKTGATVYNCGFGGCRMGQHTGYWDAFSMYRLAAAIAANDWSLQEAAISAADSTLPERFAPSLERLKSIDFSEVDIVTIAYGTNDYLGSNAVDNQEDLYDTAAFGGALRQAIETLLGAYPNVRIFVVSLTYLFFMDSEYNFTDDSGTHANSLGSLLGDYNKKSREIAEEYSLPYIDNYSIGINKHNRTQYFPATDGVHHNQNGRNLIAAHIANELF